MLAGIFLENLHKLSWAGRLSYVILCVSVWVNLRDSFEHSIEWPWRRMYFYKGVITFVGLVYYTFLIAGWLDVKDFGFAVRWLQPLILSGLCTSAFLHRWEIKQLRVRKEQEDKLKAALEDDT